MACQVTAIKNAFTERQSWCRTRRETAAELLFHVFVCSGVFLSAHPHTGTCRLEWWAAACPPYHEARHSGRYRAPYSRSSPSLRARAGGSRSTEGWHQSLWQKEIKKESTQWQTGGGSGLEREEKEREMGGKRLINQGGQEKKKLDREMGWSKERRDRTKEEELE